MKDKETRFVLCAAAAVYAIYVPVALWIDARPAAAPGSIVVRLGKFDHIEGFAFATQMPALSAFEDDQATAQRSPVILYEDKKPLGPGRSIHYDVEYVGGGRYSHWKDLGILFSTSDNSNPNRNKREYWAVLPKQ
ncbi:hypothetical protein [Bradyrhizobium australiense]|uniref:Uncharacterized protein n=1 Tax=Bradyrhizobium australiense TaxID=2721161 RepID=A0A7Y4LVI0_9BRAD|nr:hypothetical protein [Bradyrhizobium australiense]NOJ39690.1 hypothetical protein [Bradyrhizobium australiense]